MNTMSKLLEGKVKITDLKEMVVILLLLVDHKEFKQMDRSLVNGKPAVDIWGTWK